MKYLVLVIVSLVFSFSAWAQSSHTCALGKIKSYQNVMKRTRAGDFDNNLMARYDVNWYFLDLNIERNSTVISGNATIGANILAATDTFCFELNSSLTIDSVQLANANIAFTHTNNTDICYALPNATLLPNSDVKIKVFYHGDASVVGGSAIGDGFSSDNSNTWSNSVTWSLSEPYSAREWFPCKQFLQDKADSVWVYVTTDNQNKVGSNGVLQGIDNLPNNKVRYRWKSNYIIDYYLVSVAVAKYVEYKTYAYPAAMPNDSIEILNYVYDNPNTLPYFKDVIDTTGMMLEYFSDILGLYPFANEKYGHAMTPFSGGMEHQTMSSMGFFNFGLIAHELMHQWFGDYITCSTWKDIFINEAFASYGAYLATAQFRGQVKASALMQDVHDDVMSQPGGSIAFTDTTNVGRIFSGRLTYDKGNAVLHSLRFVIGDTAFFASMKNILTQNAFGNASIEDYKLVAETEAGTNLNDFFNQWVYGEGYPIYSARYFSDGSNLYLRVTHLTSSTTPTFITPLEIKCESILGGDTTIRVDVSSNNDTYVIPVGRLVNGLEIDPNNWLLNTVGSINVDPNLLALNTSNFTRLNQIAIYPNPSGGLFNISNNSNLETTYTLRTIRGEVLTSMKNNLDTQTINIANYSKGIYLLEMENSRGKEVRKLIKQ